MEKMTGCCGFKCYSCAAFEDNIHSEAERQAVCEKWDRYFEYPITTEEMHCGGCTALQSWDKPMIHGDCQYRSCAMGKGIDRCRDCEEYPCLALKEYFSDYKAVYEELKNDILTGDEEGYFFTYFVE